MVILLFQLGFYSYFSTGFSAPVLPPGGMLLQLNLVHLYGSKRPVLAVVLYICYSAFWQRHPLSPDRLASLGNHSAILKSITEVLNSPGASIIVVFY